MRPETFVDGFGPDRPRPAGNGSGVVFEGAHAGRCDGRSLARVGRVTRDTDRHAPRPAVAPTPIADVSGHPAEPGRPGPVKELPDLLDEGLRTPRRRLEGALVAFGAAGTRLPTIRTAAPRR
ncbi:MULTISPECIES: hypothetical protein [unclassified Streptomyces]|uniref:hypothetical protein n=1 Tax=unclassified Streptomyces TaxID=2593676 RepID=UPI003813B886